MSDVGGVSVAVLGYGAIGRRVANALAAGEVAGMSLSGVIGRSRIEDPPAAQVSLEVALKTSGLIVEAAGQSAVCDHAAEILRAGVDLLIVSMGALADPALRARLLACGPGRLYCTSGAVGGLDLLAAARRLAPFDLVRLTSTKRPAALVQSWMSDELVAAISGAREPLVVYRGSAVDAPVKFPASANVAAALAIATGMWAELEVVMRADPDATATTHLIEAANPYGAYRFEILNAPSESNPATSKIVPWAVLSSLSRIVGQPGQVI